MLKAKYLIFGLLAGILLLNFNLIFAKELVREAKVILVKGDVNIQKAGRTDWVKAKEGMTLTDGDAAKTAKGSVIEITFDRDKKNIIRLDENSTAILRGKMLRQVELPRGKIRFVSDDGPQVEMRPGQTLHWPLPKRGLDAQGRSAVSTPASAPSANGGNNTNGSKGTVGRRPPPKQLNHREAESMLDQVERLRSQKRYQEAVRRLRHNLPAVTNLPDRERFSYEIGAILTHHLNDQVAACRHWNWHQRTFKPGLYRKAIRKLREQLGCKSTRA